MNDWLRILWLLLAVFGVMFFSVGVVEVDVPAAPVTLPNTFDRTPAFHMDYPDGWVYQVLDVGLLLFGEVETIFVMPPQPGPSVSVFRTETFFVNTLDEALNLYLERGPLRGGHYALVGEIAETMIDDGRPALAVTIEGREFSNPDNPLMRAYVVMTQADNGYHYIISADTPAEDWAEDWPLMEAMLASVDIHE